MASGQLMVLRTLRRVLADDSMAGQSDRDLLRRFAGRRDEAAFAEILRRHGLLVLHTCRRVLHDHHAAEDVFQAAFLILARRAGSRDWHDSVASWLYTVASRLALKVREDTARRLAREQQVAPPRPIPDPLGEVTGRELCTALDEELHGLPARYRIPLVLCCLQGVARDEAAHQLGWSLGALKGRLQRGRDLLRKRLARRGLCLSAGLSALALLPETGRAALPPLLLTSALRVATQDAAAPARVLDLSEEVLAGLSVRKLKGLAAVVLVLGMVAFGLGYRQTADGPPAERKTTPPTPKGDSRPVNAEAQSDPLPAGALARLGTVRFRHGGNINAVAFSPDGKMALSAGHDNVLRLWELSTGKELGRFGERNAAQLFCAAFSPDGKTLASGGNSCLVQIWDRGGKRPRHALAGHKKPVSALAFRPDGKVLASGGWDKTIRLWNVETGKEVRVLEGHENWVLGLAFSPDSKLLASASGDKSVRLWDAETGKEIRRLKGLTESMLCVAFAPDGRLLASGGGDGKVRLWDPATGRPVRSLEPPKGTVWVRSVAFAPDGKTLAVAGGDYGRSGSEWRGGMALWDVGTGKIVRQFSNRRHPYEATAFSPDGKTVAGAGGHDSTLHFWDVATGRELHAQWGHQGSIHSIACSPDGRRILTGGGDNAVFAWTEDARKLFRAPGSYALALPDNKTVLCVSLSPRPAATFRDALSGREVRSFPLRGGTSCVALRPDGEVLASAGSDGVIRLWQVATGKELRQLEGHGGRVGSLEFSADGRRLVSASRDRTVRVWDVPAGKELRRLSEACYRAALSPDGRLVAAGGEDNAVRLWDVGRGEVVWQLPGDQNQRIRDLRSVCFSPDGRTLATGSMNCQVRLWEVATGKQRLGFDAHRGWVFALAFSPDGKRLATGSGDTTALVWDLLAVPDAGKPPTPEELRRLWDDLASPDASVAYRAMRCLIASPAQAVALLKKPLRPPAPVDAARVAKLVADLDSPRFPVRQKATAELEKLGEGTIQPLRKALEGKPSVELRRRVEQLLAKLDLSPTSSEGLRVSRAIEVLERIGTEEARQVLRHLAEGVAGSWRGQEAKASLARLRR